MLGTRIFSWAGCFELKTQKRLEKVVKKKQSVVVVLMKNPGHRKPSSSFSCYNLDDDCTNPIK